MANSQISETTGALFGAVSSDSVLASAAFADLFAALCDAKLSQLATPRRVVWNLYGAVVLAFLAVLFYFGLRYAADPLTALASGFALVGSAIGAARLGVRAVVQVHILASGARRRPRSEAGSQWDAYVGSAVDLGQLSGNVSMHPFGALIGAAITWFTETFLVPLMMKQKTKWVARLQAVTEPLVDPSEQLLVVAGPPTTMNRRGAASLLFNLNRKSVLVLLTDRRLLCYQMHRKDRVGKKLADASLTALRVREWYPSTAPVDPPGSWVLWLVDSSGTMRVSFVRAWREEAVLLFNALYAAQLARETTAGGTPRAASG